MICGSVGVEDSIRGGGSDRLEAVGVPVVMGEVGCGFLMMIHLNDISSFGGGGGG